MPTGLVTYYLYILCTLTHTLYGSQDDELIHEVAQLQGNLNVQPKF